MNVKISLVVNCIDAIRYLLLFNLHDCTFNRELLEKYSTIQPAILGDILIQSILLISNRKLDFTEMFLKLDLLKV